MRYLVCILLTVTAAMAGEWYGIGLRAGVPMSDAFDSVKTGEFDFESVTKRFTGGPSLELFLPMGLGAEVDFLYKRTEMTLTESPDAEAVTTKKTTGIWEIPVLGKFRFPGAGMRPFVGAGGSYRSFGDLPSISTNLNDTGWGVVLAGGLEIKIGRVRLSPELRYTRWGAGERGDGASVIKYARNQADFLFGITF